MKKSKTDNKVHQLDEGCEHCDSEEGEIREAVDKLDVEDIIKEARKMGITVRESTGKGHTIIEDGKEVPLDLDKHFKLP